MAQVQNSTNTIDDVTFWDNLYNSKSNPGFHVITTVTTNSASADSFCTDRDHPTGIGGRDGLLRDAHRRSDAGRDGRLPQCRQAGDAADRPLTWCHLV